MSSPLTKLSLGEGCFLEDFHRWLMAFILCLADVTMAPSRLPRKLQNLPSSVAECQPSLGKVEAVGVIRDPPEGPTPEEGSLRIVVK